MKIPANFLPVSAALILTLSLSCTGFGPEDVHQDVVTDQATDPDDGVKHDVLVDTGRDTAARDLASDDTNVPDITDVDNSPGDIGHDSVEVFDVVKDVHDVIQDTGKDNAPVDQGQPETDACVLQCGSVEGGDLRECGPDGCDGECGYCSYGFACQMDVGKCIPICIPDCLAEGKACGDDGCTGDCGDCGAGYKCGIDFQCHPDVCEPDCVAMGKECGDDGCGKSCGDCGESRVCTAEGKCGADACYGVDLERNTCSPDGRYQFICNQGPPQSLLKIDCYAKVPVENYPECGTRGCDCHYNTWSGLNECIEKPPCVPDCQDKECGDDGCGGSCDTCEGGWGCTAQFKCRPFQGAECVWIDWVGWCWEDNWLYVCSSDVMGQGTIIAENCTASGKVCYYNQASGQRFCGPPL